VRKRSDQILKYIITPIVAEYGYEAVRADKISKPGIITTQIIDHILNDPLVIADLTGHNPNVMYELALRHVIKKPVVQIIEENQLLPFDVSGNRTIKLNYKDMDSVNEAKEELRKQITEVIKNPNLVDSPISQAITLSGLKQTGDPFSKTLSNMSAAIAEMGNSIRRIEQELAQDKLRLPRVHDYEIGPIELKWPDISEKDIGTVESVKLSEFLSKMDEVRKNWKKKREERK
jgi:hypothetical protein